MEYEIVRVRPTKLWECPTCGIVGRLMHRYMSGMPYEEKQKRPDDPGPCNPRLLPPFIGEGI